ncbi:MAG: hypothetical protein II767_04980, partial [Proteobacteria bacterium]|nr:hypothetical protein [Pseudomonadota bacterium]
WAKMVKVAPQNFLIGQKWLKRPRKIFSLGKNGESGPEKFSHWAKMVKVAPKNFLIGQKWLKRPKKFSHWFKMKKLEARRASRFVTPATPGIVQRRGARQTRRMPSGIGAPNAEPFGRTALMMIKRAAYEIAVRQTRRMPSGIGAHQSLISVSSVRCIG